ncbi:site-specific DNA-methyltransferase [Bartonella rattaustraliani]|uniref:site-specific DNA-methyltransferase n=1 Tax=Bartonella rattaustraliani TaxID=481139 RepID=UPI0002F77276|nr:site-specific DNA-methyltransferase [Bartonella rattaustraliani]
MNRLKERVVGESLDNLALRIEEIKRLLPEAVVEGKFDEDMLRLLLGDDFDNDHEKYRFEWKGKQESLKLAQRRSSATLRPYFEESKDWETTQNLYIEGDNLEVLKLLQRAYLRQVKMIYIDPPYNTGNDFVYKDDFKDPIGSYKQATCQTMRANPETAGRYHSNWLSMMYPRLLIAKTLLRDDGVIFISIDDHEVHNLRKLCDEVFGEDNFVACLPWKGRGGGADDKNLLQNHEYVLVYAKNSELFTTGRKIKSDEIFPKFDQKKKRFYKIQLARKWGSNSKREDRPNLFYSINSYEGIEVFPMLPDGSEGCWRWSKDRFETALKNEDIEFKQRGDGRWEAYEKIYQPLEGEFRTKLYAAWLQSEIIDELEELLSEEDPKNTAFGTKQIQSLFEGKSYFDYPKPTTLIKILTKIASVNCNEVILDFFSGSATTAHAVMQLNAEDGGKRRFIMVQLPEATAEGSEAFKAGYKTIADIGRERIRRAGEKIKAAMENKTSFKEYRRKKVLSEDASERKADCIGEVLDVGFRCFKLDSSNFKRWNDDFSGMTEEQRWSTLVERMKDILDRFVAGRCEIDIIYEAFLKYGVPLTEKLSTLEIEGKRFYVIGEDGSLFICLDKSIPIEVIEALIRDYAPGTVIFAKHCFDDDAVMVNSELILQEAEITFRWL